MVCWVVRTAQVRHSLDIVVAHHRYEVAKEDSKAKLQISKAKLASVDDEIRERFRVMEEVSALCPAVSTSLTPNRAEKWRISLLMTSRRS